MPENEKKDFLDQFSDAGKPASFKEEERIPVQKEKKPVNVKMIAIVAAVLVLLAIAAYFLFFAPKIEMPNFVGQNRTDVAAWVKQQGIETSGVVFSEEYDFDTAEGTVLSQSVQAGKKVKNNVKLNFVLSKGADPDERVSVPDLDNMDKEEIQDWIKTNKLSKTKISTSYNENVEADRVIDYAFTGCEEDSFTRGCSLKINVSKGSAPAGKVTVEDFSKKTYDYVETWAKSKKVNVEKSEQYSDKVDKDYIISQSVESGKTMNEGETLYVTVSLGKAIYMPNMIGWSDAQLKSWEKTNPSVSVYTDEVYSGYEKGTVIGQDITTGRLIKDSDYLLLTISLGNVVEFPSCVGQDYHAPGGLHDKKDEANAKDAEISVNKTYDFSDDVKADCIISHDTKVEVGGTLNIKISRGRNIYLTDYENPKYDSTDPKSIKTYEWSKITSNNEEYARTLCDAFDVTYVVQYKLDESKQNGDVISIVRQDNGSAPVKDTYLPQDVTVVITVCDNG